MNFLCDHTYIDNPGIRTLMPISHSTPLIAKKGIREKEKQPLPACLYSNLLFFQVSQESQPSEAIPVITYNGISPRIGLAMKQ